MKTSKVIGILFLTAQLLSLLVARYIPEKFFCWAPYDEHTRLQTKVVIDNTELGTTEINKRYRYGLNYWEPRSIHNVFNIVEQYERTYGALDSAEVTIRYSTNGHAEKVWHYPKPAE